MAADQRVEDMVTVNLRALLDAGEGTAVTLVAGDTRLTAHRAVLAARSPVFRAMFGHDTLEASSGQVTIKDVEGAVLRDLVAYLYTLQAPQPADAAPQLLVAADRYGVLGLKAECERQLAANLTVQNAATAAVLAVRYRCPDLERASVAFIKSLDYQVMATQGWADAIVNWPEELQKVVRLLTEASAETRRLSAENKGQRLIEMAEKGAVDEVRELLAAGADVAARDGCGRTALHCAALGGHDTAARVLLEHGAEVDAKDGNLDTPLNLAAWKGHQAAVRLLLGFSANPNTRDHRGYFPLHWAAEKHKEGIVAELLDAGADKGVRDYSGLIPLDVASQVCNRYCGKCIKYMLN